MNGFLAAGIILAIVLIIALLTNSSYNKGRGDQEQVGHVKPSQTTAPTTLNSNQTTAPTQIQSLEGMQSFAPRPASGAGHGVRILT